VTRRAPLPPEVLGRGIAVRAAQAAGIGEHRLRAKDLEAPIRGARVPAGGTKLDAVCALLSPGQAFTGPTSAKIWGMPLPRRWQNESRFWVSALSTTHAMRRPGVVGTRRTSGNPILVRGYPVLDAARTWCSLSAMLEVHDLVAVGDRIISTSPRSAPLATLDSLDEAMAGWRRGKAVLQAARGELRVGSWSRTESLLRVALLRAGLPEPRLNEEIQVGRGRVAVPDLAWPEFGVCAEYDGHWHDDPRRRAQDLERHELLVDAGWLVTHLRAGDLFPEPLVAVARIVRRLASRGYIHGETIQRAEATSWLP
jgi:very-short-patch-repair endonuclease